MNRKKIMIVSAVAALVLGAIVAISIFKRAPLTEQTQTKSVVQNVTPEPTAAGTMGSIKSLLAAGKNVSCEISYPDQSLNGTTFVSSNKMRSDFNIKAGEKNMETHMISDGTYAYVWTDAVKQGTKIKLDALNQTATAGAKTQAPDLDRQVNMKCAPWAADNSKFTPPTDIQFTDLSAMLKAPTGSGAPKIDKSICDNITDPTSKAACVKALSGN